MRKQIIIILCFLMVFVCLGFCGSTRSLYLVPITEALDIPRSVFSLTLVNSCYIAAVVSTLLLAFLEDTGIGMALAMIYAVVFSFSLPLQTVSLPFFSKDLFNPRAYNLTLGLFVSINTAGYACAGPVMNRVFDVSGSYKMICNSIR